VDSNLLFQVGDCGDTAGIETISIYPLLRCAPSTYMAIAPFLLPSLCTYSVEDIRIIYSHECTSLWSA
jgi:hypothetical protein